MQDTFKVVSATGTNQKRAYVANYKGKDYLHIREWYEDKTSGEYKPSPKGITFKVDEIDALIKALTEVKNEIPVGETPEE